MSSFPFLDIIGSLPLPVSQKDAERGRASLLARLRQADNAALLAAMENILMHPKANALLDCIFGYSPFLSRIVMQDTGFFTDICVNGVDACFSNIKAAMMETLPATPPALMKMLRTGKSRASFLIAIADICGLWPLEKVTQGMSEIAEICIQRTIAFLLMQAHAKGDIAPGSLASPEFGSGLIVLAMGKLGAWELNYSSDIDLIILFEKETVRYTGRQSMEIFFPRLAQEMVRLLQERNAEGYVFRVDLRLRPDPASTSVALSTSGAIAYYETVGQNWERAAMIKARPVAGDMEAGYRFLKQIAPFIWRRHLDFAAIADIQSIKRQMDARTARTIEIPGHNVKTGLGGIREIEFFAQIHQLIWGGREPSLRISGTCATLKALAGARLISDELAARLTESYHFLRMVEHRLQMVDDQQTHSIPLSADGRDLLAGFMDFSDTASFEKLLLEHLEFVHSNFAESFRGQSALGGDEGKLSFTGVENDPQTVETLRKMGYGNPSAVSEAIQSWHRGTWRSTRTQRARELITELTPTLLNALAQATSPDQAFLHFNAFLSRLPAGVQLFSLFSANPQLLDLIAVIMGSAPALAELLSKNPNLLDTVLTLEFFQRLPGKEDLFDELAGQLVLARDFEDEMDIVRKFKSEKQFQAGIQLIRHQISASEAGIFLSDVADTSIEALLHRVEVHYGAKHKLRNGLLATVALGRLGARELTFGSDIDLVFVYDAPRQDVYTRLSQRFISALTTLTKDGRLYEVDTRLRPSGNDGLPAVNVSAFDKYLGDAAWTFELMAMTRARVITGNPALKEKLTGMIKKHLAQPRNQVKLRQDILDLRIKITREFGSDNSWNLKYAHGGLMDLDFIAQYFVLLHAPKYPDLIGHSTGAVFMALTELGLIDSTLGASLLEAHRFMTSLFVLLRLCTTGAFDEAAAPFGLKQLIAKGVGLPDFIAVKAELMKMLGKVQEYWRTILIPTAV